jgi:formylglycine-generating enzyme required for sulfatase activity
MFSRKEQEPLPDFSDVFVKLKPFLGLQPGVYLTILYSLVFLFVIFMVLFYPGLKAYGTYINFHSVPDRAAVWVDGEYKGSTPCVAFVKKGTRNIEIRKSYFKTVSVEQTVKGRLVGTLFFPLRSEFRTSIEIQDLDGYLDWIFKEWTEWGMLSRFAANYPLPKHLSEASMVTWTSSPQERKATQDLIASLLIRAADYVDSPEELMEIIKALLYSEAAGGIFDSASLRRAGRRMQSFFASHPAYPYWLLLSLPSRRSLESPDSKALTADHLARTDSFKRFHSEYLRYLESFSPQEQIRKPGNRILLGGIALREVPGGPAVLGKDPRQIVDRVDLDLPYPALLDSFYMAETEVTNQQYREFLRENPEWAKSNIEALMRRGDVTEQYLADWEGESFPEGASRLPVTGVSFSAAGAYCSWLESKLPGSLAGYEVRLPYDAEWEWAARSGEREDAAKAVFGRQDGPEEVDLAQPDALGLRNMKGNVWEWCEDWYRPAMNLLTGQLPAGGSRSSSRSSWGGIEKVVRGGSWANSEEDIDIDTRGSQSPDWCTPYLGFRVVAAKK